MATLKSRLCHGNRDDGYDTELYGYAIRKTDQTTNHVPS